MEQQAHDPDQQLTERYFLGELTTAEAEEFEAHYFECSRCAENVVETQMLFDAGRAVALERTPAAATAAPVVRIDERKRRWKQWFPMAAAASLVVVAWLPTLRERKPETIIVTKPAPLPVVATGVFPRMAAVGSERSDERLKFKQGDIEVPIHFVPVLSVADQRYDERYEVRVVLDGTERVVWTSPIDSKVLETVEFEVKPGVLPAGLYEVQIVQVGGNPLKTVLTVPIEVEA